MTKKKRTSSSNVPGLLFLAALVFLVIQLGKPHPVTLLVNSNQNYTQNHSQTSIFEAVAAIFFAVISCVVAKSFLQNNFYISTMSKIDLLIDQHAKALSRRRAQLVNIDHYGNVVQTKWHLEQQRFLEEIILQNLTPKEKVLFLSQQEKSIVLDKINLAAENFQNDSTGDVIFEGMNPIEFEIFCANEIEKAGWSARVTSIGKDQGVDVIGEKNGVRVVIQCKLHNRPVGNKAVQEIFAAKTYEQADYAVVATIKGFTPSAKQLANANKVLLLLASDLKELDRFLD